MNNLLAPGASPAVNSLVAKPQASPQARLASMHAAIPGAVSGLNLSAQQLAKEISLTAYGAQQFGALARNPDVTHKDVINSAGQAVADGQVTPTQAVAMLSQVPQDPDKLKDWLDHKYATGLALNVHLKALAMGAAPSAPPPGAPMAAAPQAGMNPNAAPAPGNAPEPVPTGV